MAGQTVNANIAFSEFTKTMSICIFSRILYIGSLILLLISGIFLLTCYLLIVCSKFIEKLIFRMTMDYDSSIIKNVFDNTIQIISNRINDLIGWKIIPGPEIKKEAEIFYDRSHDRSDDYVYSSCDETEVDSSYDSDDDKNVFSGESDEQVSVSEVSTIQTLDPEEEQEQNSEADDEEQEEQKQKQEQNSEADDEEQEEQKQEQNPEDEQEPDKNEQNMISDIEDVTEQVIAERERALEKQKIRDLIDLSSDSD